MPDLSREQLIQYWLNEILRNGVNLTTWEEDFIESLNDQWTLRGSLSDKQKDILERIYAERVP